MNHTSIRNTEDIFHILEKERGGEWCVEAA